MSFEASFARLAAGHRKVFGARDDGEALVTLVLDNGQLGAVVTGATTGPLKHRRTFVIGGDVLEADGEVSVAREVMTALGIRNGRKLQLAGGRRVRIVAIEDDPLLDASVNLMVGPVDK